MRSGWLLVLAGCTAGGAIDWAEVVPAVRPSGESDVLDALERRARDILASRGCDGPLRERLARSLGLNLLPAPEARNLRMVGTIDRGAYRIEKLVYETLPGVSVLPAGREPPCGAVDRGVGESGNGGSFFAEAGPFAPRSCRGPGGGA
jgi:hypothetical protein